MNLTKKETHKLILSVKIFLLLLASVNATCSGYVSTKTGSANSYNPWIVL